MTGNSTPLRARRHDGRPRRPWLPFAAELLWGRRLPLHAQLARQTLLRRRARALAGASALLVLAWMPIDAWALGAQGLSPLLLRMLLAAALGLLVWAAPRLPAAGSVVLLIAVQASGFAVLTTAIDGEAPRWLVAGYRLLPFVLVAQLAILPLAALHVLLLAMPAALLMLMALAVGESPSALLHELWLFGLLTAVAMWAGSAQLGLLLHLLAARWDAAHDALTGLSNRRAFDERLQGELARDDRRGGTPSVLLLDLDRFKRINDRYGHARGDDVLRTAAMLIEDTLRAADIAGRWGGEEFIALLPDTELEEAVRVAERIRAALARTVFDFGDGAPVSVTISIGVATRLPGESAEAMIARADTALYAAKANGRNRVEAARPG